MLQRGFWLYVWQVETPEGEMLYVGRTGDNSSPNATEPYACIGEHPEGANTRKATRRHLLSRGAGPEGRAAFRQTRRGMNTAAL
jgi:hypothetical protein